MLHLEIISPEGIIFNEEVSQVSLPTPDGEITILPHHADLYGKIGEGEAVIHKSGKTEYIAVLGGFVEIKNNTVSVLSNYAIPTDKIVAARAQEAKQRAEKLLEEKAEDKDFALIEHDLQRAILELNISEKVKKRQRSS